MDAETRSARFDDDLAALLADLPLALIGSFDPSDHAAAVNSLPIELLAARPRALVHLADSYIVAGHAEAYAETLRRAASLLERPEAPELDAGEALEDQHPGLVAHDGGCLQLRSGTVIDAEEFLAFTQQATAATSNAAFAASAALAALALYQGEPAAPLGDPAWLAPVRRTLRGEVLALHDRLADAAEHDGRLDDALRWLTAAIELEPVGADRYLAAARLLAEQGRRARAIHLLTEGRHVLATAGRDPGEELDNLEAYLRRNPDGDAAAS